MELTFDSGVKEYTIRGVNGIVTVYFNPADVNFAKKAYKTFDDLRKKQETRAKTLEKDIPDDELFDMVDSLDKEMRSIIMTCLGRTLLIRFLAASTHIPQPTVRRFGRTL